MTDDKQIKFPEPEPCHAIGGTPRISIILDVLIVLGIGALLLIVVIGPR